MASLVPERKCWRIDFNLDGKRSKLRLGKVNAKQGEAVKSRVEHILAARVSRQPLDAGTAEWVGGLDGPVRRRMENLGLVERVERNHTTLGLLVEEFFAASTIKPGSVVTQRQTTRCLLAFFGESRRVRDVGPLDADKWRQDLVAQNLAGPTVSKRVKTARQVFKSAVRWKMVDANPFADVKAGKQTNRERMRFISQDTIEKVIAACPDAQWRLLVGLSYWGGLRCPSEHLALKWSDVMWDAKGGRLRVWSRKTEHYDGGESRIMPLWPELRPLLREVLDQAEPGTEHVITRYRNTNANLRTQLLRIIERAGVKPWPRLFHNLRATRQTVLAARRPGHVVCEWLGNSLRTAGEHYLLTTDADFDAELVGPTPQPTAARKAARHTAASSGDVKQPPEPDVRKPQQLPGFAAGCHTSLAMEVTPTGFEPVSPP